MARRKKRGTQAASGAALEQCILDLAHLGPQEELAHKHARVTRALSARGIRCEVPFPSPSPRRLGARARIALNVGVGGRLVNHAPGSHVPIDPPLDAMARPEVAAAARALTALLVKDPSAAEALARVELRTDGQRVVAVLEARGGRRVPRALGATLADVLGDGGGVAVGGRTLAGDARLRLHVADLELGVGPLSFFQVNLEVNQRLVERVVGLLTDLRPAAVLDLFGGVGNLAFPIAAGGVPVELVESSPGALADARANAVRTGLPVTAIRGDAYRIQPGAHFFDVAVLDPPRKGAGAAMAAVCATRPRAILLLSCHPPALAKDVQQALAEGYRLALLELHDMFPLTSHVESLALLLR